MATPDLIQPGPPPKASIARSSPLSHQVYAMLCEHLVSGELRPGERIILEHLATQLGVSPTPVREAQNGLITDGPGGRLRYDLGAPGDGRG
jgi:DNA-binding GntR family transcriptional regulator